jgi:uncharacterized membrane protein YuzA (DUF378 family)
VSIYGGGYHAWDLRNSETIGFFKVVYGGSMLYNLNAYSVKLTLLLLTVRVFGSYKRTSLIAYVLVVLFGLYYIPIVFIKSQACRPVAGFWDPDVPATCLDRDLMFAADTVISAVSDVSILLLPIPATLYLRLSWQKKMKVIVMLGAGGLATVASIARMVLVLQLRDSVDATVDIIRFNLLGYVLLPCSMHCFHKQLTDASGSSLKKKELPRDA